MTARACRLARLTAGKTMAISTETIEITTSNSTTVNALVLPLRIEMGEHLLPIFRSSVIWAIYLICQCNVLLYGLVLLLTRSIIILRLKLASRAKIFSYYILMRYCENTLYRGLCALTGLHEAVRGGFCEGNGSQMHGLACRLDPLFRFPLIPCRHCSSTTSNFTPYLSEASIDFSRGWPIPIGYVFLSKTGIRSFFPGISLMASYSGWHTVCRHRLPC